MTCLKHTEKPVKGYHDCAGCEIEWLRGKVEKLENLLRPFSLPEINNRCAASKLEESISEVCNYFRLQKKNPIKITTVRVNAFVRYWEDALVNGKEDVNGTLIPCREEDIWMPIIDLKTGKIKNWKIGATAKVHYKICDEGIYIFLDEDGEVVYNLEGYVPSLLCPKENGYGDYIIMDVDENGQIDGWDLTIPSFKEKINSVAWWINEKVKNCEII